MAHVDLRQLVNRLNTTAKTALEAAVGLCVARTNYHVEVEHWILKLLEGTNTDFIVLLRHFGIDDSHLLRDLTRSVDRLRTGNSREPALSPDLVQLIRESWLMASINFGSSAARTGHVLCALLSDDSLARIAADASAEFTKVLPDV